MADASPLEPRSGTKDGARSASSGFAATALSEDSCESREKLLFLTHRLPWPPDRGDRIRSWHLLHALSEKFDVYLAAISEEGITDEQQAKLEQVTKRFAWQPLGKGMKLVRAGMGVVKGEPITCNVFYDRKLARIVIDWHSEVRFDAVVTFCSGMVGYSRLIFRAEAEKEEEGGKSLISKELEFCERRRNTSSAKDSSQDVEQAAFPEHLELGRAEQSSRPVHLLDLVDVDSKKWERYAAQAEGANGVANRILSVAKKWVYAREARKLREVELGKRDVIDGLSVVSKAELEVYQGLSDGAQPKAFAVTNGVNLDFFRPLQVGDEVKRDMKCGEEHGVKRGTELGMCTRFGSGLGASDTARSVSAGEGAAAFGSESGVTSGEGSERAFRGASVITSGGGGVVTFVGVLDYKPNVEAVRWFAREVMGKVRVEVPGAEFRVVGKNPGKDVKGLDGVNGTVIIGEVDDVRPWVWGSDAVVAPLRIAPGVQNKVLEAMAMGKAVVCSEGAARGVEAVNGRDLMVADSAAEYAEAVVMLLKHEEVRDAIGSAARAQVESYYQWDRLLRPLVELVQRWCKKRTNLKKIMRTKKEPILQEKKAETLNKAAA